MQLLNIGADMNGAGDSETGYGLSVGGGVTVLTSEHLGVAIELAYVYSRFSLDFGDESESVTGNTIAIGAPLLGFIH